MGAQGEDLSPKIGETGGRVTPSFEFVLHIFRQFFC